MVEFALENNTQLASDIVAAGQQQQQQSSLSLLQQPLSGAIPRTPARLPEDVTALATCGGGDAGNQQQQQRDGTATNKNAVTKTYHTLKDLISGKFKKDNIGSVDELMNNAAHQPQHQQQHQQQQQQLQQSQQMPGKISDDDYRSPYSALPLHMRSQIHQGLNQSQPNIWNGATTPPSTSATTANASGSFDPTRPSTSSYALAAELPPRGVQQRAISQPQLNMSSFDQRRGDAMHQQQQLQQQQLQHQSPSDRCGGSLANIDVTDSDEGGFASRGALRRPHTMYQTPGQQQQQPQPYQLLQQQQQQQRQSPQNFPNTYGQPQSSYMMTPPPQSYQQHSHHNQTIFNYHQQQQQQQQQQHDLLNSQQQQQQQQLGSILTQDQQEQQIHIQNRQDALRASFQKQMTDIQQQQQQLPQSSRNYSQDYQVSSSASKMLTQRSDIIRHQTASPTTTTSATAGPSSHQQQSTADISSNNKPMPMSSSGSSDYEKNGGNHSSNVDSGRGSAAYSSGRKISALDTDSLDLPRTNGGGGGGGGKMSGSGGGGGDDSEWVDIVDSELRHILEPGMQTLSIRPESTVSGSVSSMSPPLPPLSPDGSSTYKPIKQSKDKSKQEYGTDSYNRPGRVSGPIGPSRAGWPGTSVQKQGMIGGGGRMPSKKHEQALLKRHLFGLDNDMTSTTTRSLDLESILGGPWGTGQSVSDSETDTQGIRHIRSQLEGLEHMYGEVLKMLGSRSGGGGPPNRIHDSQMRSIGNGAVPSRRRRHGSLSSLPSSSVSGRPIRDKRRSDDRRKVRDMKGINQRFQRLESHVVTLARSVAHLSSEMRSQHLVTQELERLRDDLTNLRSQASRSERLYRSTAANNDPEPPNLTNPRRVKKLTKFFGEDPPLMRLFLKNLGYEKYANLFEAERVGMIELPYLGEERLQKLGVPLGPRLRILQEAQISLCKDTTLCIV